MSKLLEFVRNKSFLIFMITFIAFATAAAINVARWEQRISSDPTTDSLSLITGDEPAALLLTANIVNHHTIFLEEFFNTEKGDNKLILPHYFYENPWMWLSQQRSDGHYVSAKEPGLSFILVPGYMLAGIFGAMITISLATTIISVTIYKFTSEVTTEKIGFFTTLIFSFGTLLFTYSNQIYSDVLISLFLILIIYFIFQKPKSSICISCAGAFLGFGVFLKILFVLIDVVVFPVLLILLINRKIPKGNFVLFLSFFGFFTILAILHNIYAYESWIGGMNTQSALDVLLHGKTTRGVSAYDLESWRTGAIIESFFGKFHGLFIYSPILLLFPLGTAKLWHRKKALFITISLVSILIWFGYIWINPNSILIAGDPPFRYFMPIIPLMSIFFSVGLHEFGHSIKYKIIALFTLIIGISFSISFGFDRLLSIDGSVWKSKVISQIYVGTDWIFPNLGATYTIHGEQLPYQPLNIYNIIFVISMIIFLLVCILISFSKQKSNKMYFKNTQS